MIPKPQHLDALLRQKAISFLVARTLIGKSVPATIGFNRETSSNTEKIQKVNAAGILAVEFEFLKAAGTKQTPQTLLGVCGFAS